MGSGMVAINLSGKWGYTPETDPRLKDITLIKRYAAEQLRRSDEENRDYRIALEILLDPGLATSAVEIWNNDPVLLQERLRLQEEFGERAELPTKETLTKEVLALGRTAAFTVAERLNAYKLVGEMMGFIGRGAAQPTSVAIFANKVMAVKDHGSDDDWESRAAKQQADLVQAAKDDATRNQTHH